jgi:hypothetical protein
VTADRRTFEGNLTANEISSAAPKVIVIADGVVYETDATVERQGWVSIEDQIGDYYLVGEDIADECISLRRLTPERAKNAAQEIIRMAFTQK